MYPCSVNQRLPSGPGGDLLRVDSGRGDGELGDGAGRRVDLTDFVAGLLDEPEVAIGPRHDPCRVAAGGGDREIGDHPGRWVDPTDAAGMGLGEPEVAVGPERDIASRVGEKVGRGNGEVDDSASRWVDLTNGVAVRLGEPEVAVGPHRDPRGIALVAEGGELGDAFWVVGLISPILLVLNSVNQRLPSGPATIPTG